MINNKTDIIFGLHPVVEALNSGVFIDKIWMNPKKGNPLFKEVMDTGKELGIPIIRVPQEKLNAVCGKNNQGVIAYLSPVPFQNINEILTSAYEKGEDPFLVMLDKVSDVRNFGAICRSAEAAGAHAVVVGQKGAALISGDAVKTSAGALMNIPICRVSSLWQSVVELQNSGIKVVGFSEKGAQNYFEENLEGPVAMVMGSEETGISREVQEKLDSLLRIPLEGKTSSLNVSVAAGIGIFEIVRQRFKQIKK